MSINLCACNKETPVPVCIKTEYKENSVSVVACDSKGEIYHSGHLLTIYPDGTVYRHYGVNRTLGFQLDSKGRIELKRE